MSPYDERLKKYMEQHRVAADHLMFDSSCHSVEEAAAAAGVQPEDLIKSICMIGRTGRLFVAIVKGEDRADRRLVGEHFGEKSPRLAKPEEILERTGYPCGGTPPFGFDACFVVDERVMEMPVIYGGGGTPTSLVRMTPGEIERLGASRGRIRVMEKTESPP